MKATTVVTAISMALCSAIARAHDDAPSRKDAVDVAKAEQKPFGRAGDATVAMRAVRVTMKDTMRFSPATLVVRRGDTVRFIVRNDGKLLHEMVLGTEEELAKHAELMRKFPDMVHDEPYIIHVKPGQTENMVWTFNRPGRFRFACLVPGHYEAGMVGRITVN